MDLREQLAAIEHRRWADWQLHLHSKGERTGEHITGTQGEEVHLGSLILPPKYVENLEKLARTPYEQLTPEQRDNDLAEVDRYWPLIQPYIELWEVLKQEYGFYDLGAMVKELRDGVYVVVGRDAIDGG